MSNAKWVSGTILIVGAVTMLAPSIIAIDAAKTPNSQSLRLLQAKSERHKASEQFRFENNREWVRMQEIDFASGKLPRSSTRVPATKPTSTSGSARTSGATPPPPSPGQEIGFTSYELQSYGSQGHQIARKGGDGVKLHFTWVGLDYIPLSGVEYEGQKVVKYANFIDPENYPAMDTAAGTGYNGVSLTSLVDLGGSPSIDVDSFNHAHVGVHLLDGEPFGRYGPWHFQFPFADDTYQLWGLTADELGCPGQWTVGGVLWPRIAADRSDEVLHLIAHTNIYDCPDNKLGYWRFNPAIPNWEGPAIIDNTEDITYALAVDDVGDKVAVVTHHTVGGYTNVYYVESQNDGLDWLALTPNVDPLPVGTQITSYGSPDPQTAWLHLTAAYDNSSVLHIMWDEQAEPGMARTSIKHWNSSRNTIRTAAIGYWDNPMSNGTFDLNLAKLSMGIGDGSTLCNGGAESNANYIYCIYTQFGGNTIEEQSDYSAAGYMNGEVYLAVSSTGGNTWAPPVNLTNTKTPNCNPGETDVNGNPQFPDNVCRSENWATINRVVKDIDIMFISDLDAGSVIYGAGTWQLNCIHYLQLPGGSINAPYLCPAFAPNFDAQISEDLACGYHAAPWAQDEATLTIANLGNGELSGSVSVTDFPGAPTLTVSQEGAYSIAAGAVDLSITVTMSANDAPIGVYSGSIAITHNDAGKQSPYLIPIDFAVSTSICPQTGAYVKTGAAGPGNSPGSLQLAVSSYGNFAAEAQEGGLWRHRDSSSSISDGSLLVAHGTQGPDTTVYLNVFNRATDGQNGYRPLADLNTNVSAYGTGEGCATAFARMCTADSAVGIDVGWYFPQDYTLDEFILARYKFYRNKPDVPVENLTLGILADFDVYPGNQLQSLQNGPTNTGGLDVARNLIWQTGTDNGGGTPPNTPTRYRAGMVIPDGPLGAYVGNSYDDIIPGSGPTDGFLYGMLTSLDALETFADSATDMYVLVALDRNRSIAPGETLSYTVAFLSDTLDEPSFLATADQVNALASTLCLCSCPCKYDPACDGTISDVLDVVSVVDAAFRNDVVAPTPLCPKLQADVDASGVTDLVDVVKVVNVAFRAQTIAANYVDPCM